MDYAGKDATMEKAEKTRRSARIGILWITACVFTASQTQAYASSGPRNRR